MIKIYNLHTTALWMTYVHTIPSFATFLEAFTAVSFQSSETALKTKDKAAKHSVSTFNKQIYLSWIKMSNQPRASLYFIRHLVLFLFQSQHELLLLISSIQLPFHASIYTVTTAAGWAELTYWKRHWCWERLTAEEKGTTDSWMASPVQ